MSEMRTERYHCVDLLNLELKMLSEGYQPSIGEGRYPGEYQSDAGTYVIEISLSLFDDQQ